MQGYAIFHILQPDGQVVAHSESHPGWALISPSLRDSKKRAESELMKYIVGNTTFTHYEVPLANGALRGDVA